MKREIIGTILVLLFTISSCFKEKNLAPPSNQNMGQTNVIEMGPEYTDQFFFSLETNSVISHNSRFIYDLMFDCAPGKFNIWLNTAKFMSLVQTNKASLDAVTINDTTGIDFRYELGEFNPDSNSFGQWWNTLSAQPVSSGKVYIVNLGKDAQGNATGFMKMKVNDFFGSSYSVTYSAIDDSDSATALISKDPNRNYSYFSFANGIVNIEPDKSLWDLCFTRYTIIFYEPDFTLPYEVTGVLHNPDRVQAYMDSTVVFDSIDIADFNTARLLTRRDAVGYTWKLINDPQNLAYYSIKFNYTYFIKADENRYYKLRFFDFYRNGLKGYPAFEYYQL